VDLDELAIEKMAYLHSDHAGESILCETHLMSLVDELDDFFNLFVAV